MKRPYLKKIGDFSGISVYYVSGYWIRKNFDKQFPNFGYREICPYIPKNELWIDYENGSIEARYWIDYFIALRKAINKGKSYLDAVKEANKIEKRERAKSKLVKKLKKIKIKEKLIKRIHKQKLFSKYTKKIKIWKVRGNLVRSLFDLDFNQGGHDLVYPFIPKGEIWIDDDLYKKEIPFVLIHELHERRLMANGWKYDSGAGTSLMSRKEPNSAHFKAEELEFLARKNPKKVKKILLREISFNENLTNNL